MSQVLTLKQLDSHDSRPQRVGGREVRYLCPLSDVCASKPRDNAHRSLCVNTQTGVYCCHRCQSKGKLKDFWEQRKPLKRNQRAALVLRSRFTVTLDDKTKTKQPSSDLDSLANKFNSYRSAFANSPAAKYLEGRSIPQSIAEESGCGYAQAWEHWTKGNGDWKLLGKDRRVIFPLWDQNGKLVAFHGRAIDDNFIGSSKITKGDKSLGVFLTPNALSAHVVAICEGAVDALALWVSGVAAIAMTGTTLPDWLLLKLAFRPMLIATDADKAGDISAIQLSKDLSARGANPFRLRPVRAKDWAEALQTQDVQQLRESLVAFSVSADDDIRAENALDSFHSGNIVRARFIVSLIEDNYLRESFLLRIRESEVTKRYTI